MTTPDDFQRWLRAGVLFWSGYFLVLMAVDWWTTAPETLPALYMLYFGGAIILLPILAFLPRLPERLGRGYPILLLGLMATLSFLGVTVILPLSGVEPWFAIQATSFAYIRQWVPNLIVVTLLAYGYRGLYVVLFVGFITIFDMTAAALRLPPETHVNYYVLSLIANAILLIVGLGINRVFQQLRVQQRALQRANVQLLEFNATVEDLATSRERNRIARELHDTLAHSLSGLIIQLETSDAYWDVEPQTAHDLLGQSVETARFGLQETRRALKALRASPLQDLGLALALKQLAENAAQRASLVLSFSVPSQFPALPVEMEECIYRVAQEATTNVVQYANARCLDLWLSKVDGRIMLNVHDDGVGFNLTQNSHSGHYGIPGMEERARLAGGNLKLRTRPGQGTMITLDLPLRQRS